LAAPLSHKSGGGTSAYMILFTSALGMEAA